MNTAAMTIPRARLVGELERRRERKLERKAELDARHGPGRIPVTSYMENIGWPELFGYEMPRVYADPGFAAEQWLRELIFWADNVDDDIVPEAVIPADVGWYWDITLFGARIRVSPIGVPEFDPHPLREGLDVAKLGRFDFRTMGDMPRMLAKYEALLRIADGGLGGKPTVTLPCFHRGPLDVFMQMRGYEGFVDDAAERPDELAAALGFLVDERLRFARERQRYLGEASLPPTTYVADDWVNVPFLSPGMIRDIALPLYRRIRAEEGPVTGFHTCGFMEPVAADLVSVFPEIEMLEVSPWNDVGRLDAILPARIGFVASVLNTVSLAGTEEEQRAKVTAIRDAGRHRRMHLVAQAVVRLQPTYEETLARLNAFLRIARGILYA
jgi:hypothetical protein